MSSLNLLWLLMLATFTISGVIAQPIGGTIVFGRITKDTIVVGTDSGVSDRFGNLTTEKICKIVQCSPNMFAAAAGAITDSETFSLLDSIRQICSDKSARILDRVTLFEKRVYPSLFDFMEMINCLFNKRDTLIILFFGFQDTRSTVSLVSFNPRYSLGTLDTVLIFRRDYPEERPDLNVYFGSAKHNISTQLSANRSFFQGTSIANGVYSLVESQILSSPTKLAFPIDIICMTKDTVYWSYHKPECFPKEE